MNKIFLTFLFISISNSIISKEDLIISIPKCGTHLLQKCIMLITNSNVETHYTHSKYNPKNIKTINDLYNRKFFIIRDPRDQLISFIFHGILRRELYKNNPEMLEKIKGLFAYDHLNFSQKINKLIIEGDPFYSLFGLTAQPTHGIAKFFESYLGWKKLPGICFIKFENLIGSKGGGSSNKQILEISKIAKHLNIKLTQQQILNVTSNLFGETNTFREGKLGSWKKYFTRDHKELFKIYAGNLLIELGYEKDFNW